MDWPKPRAVLFDWDGTLVDSWPVLAESINATRVAFDLPAWSTAEVHANIRHSLRDAFPRWFGDRWEAAKAHYLSHFEAIHLERLAAIRGAERLLASLVESRLPLAVVSNKTGRFLRAEAAQLGWTHLFHSLVGATDAAADKPAADPVHLALEGSGIAAGPDVLLIGDTEIDIETARAAGCRPVLVNDTLAAPPASDVPHLPDLSALLHWIMIRC